MTTAPADDTGVTDPAPRPAEVVVAAALSAVYSLGLLWFGWAALTVLVRTGGWGDRNAARGMVVVGVLGVTGAGLLVGGAVRTWRGSFAWTLVPLLAVLVFGSIGEVVDLLGTTSDPQGNLIGALILAAAAVPVALLGTGRARRFAATHRGRS